MENFMEHNVAQRHSDPEAPTEIVPDENIERKFMNATSKKVSNLL
jgi:hypothetical protein